MEKKSILKSDALEYLKVLLPQHKLVYIFMFRDSYVVDEGYRLLEDRGNMSEKDEEMLFQVRDALNDKTITLEDVHQISKRLTALVKI